MISPTPPVPLAFPLVEKRDGKRSENGMTQVLGTGIRVRRGRRKRKQRRRSTKLGGQMTRKAWLSSNVDFMGQMLFDLFCFLQFSN